MYFIIFFYEENSVEGVPKSWVHKRSDGKTYCYWPDQYNKNKISKLVKDNAPLSETWKVFPCVVKTEAADYHSMLVRAKEAEIATTEVSTSTDEEFAVSKNRSKQHIQSDSDESLEMVPLAPFKRSKTHKKGEQNNPCDYFNKII